MTIKKIVAFWFVDLIDNIKEDNNAGKIQISV